MDAFFCKRTRNLESAIFYGLWSFWKGGRHVDRCAELAVDCDPEMVVAHCETRASPTDAEGVPSVELELFQFLTWLY